MFDEEHRNSQALKALRIQFQGFTQELASEIQKIHSFHHKIVS